MQCTVCVDVLSISWSPDSSFLASCSIDNTVIVWNAHKFPGSYTTQLCLSQHITFIAFRASRLFPVFHGVGEFQISHMICLLLWNIYILILFCRIVKTTSEINVVTF